MAGGWWSWLEQHPKLFRIRMFSSQVHSMNWKDLWNERINGHQSTACHSGTPMTMKRVPWATTGKPQIACYTRGWRLWNSGALGSGNLGRKRQAAAIRRHLCSARLATRAVEQDRKRSGVLFTEKVTEKARETGRAWRDCTDVIERIPLIKC